jgi:hypothetical protein
MKAFTILALMISLAAEVGVSQPEDYYLRRIQRKVESDLSGSNVFYIELKKSDFESGALRKVKLTHAGKPISIEPMKGQDYKILFLKGNEMQPGFVWPISIEQISVDAKAPSDSGAPGIGGSIWDRSTGGAGERHKFVYTMREFVDLHRSSQSLDFDAICEFIRGVSQEEPGRVKACRTKDLGGIQRGGLTSLNNLDFLNYARVNDYHLFRNFGQSGRGRRVEVGSDSSTLPYYVDLTFSRVSVSHEILSSEHALSLRGFGLEFGFGDRTLNLLSYQAPYLRWGGRFLIGLRGNSNRLEDEDFLDLKILGRSKMNTAKLINRMKLNELSPVMSLNPPLLNVTSGVAFDFSFSRFSSRLPFVSISYSRGSEDFSNPYVRFGSGGSKSAYFSTIQWEASLSYYWNTDMAKANRFRLDLGAGAYKVCLVDYNQDDQVIVASVDHPLSSVQILIALDYTHCSNNSQTLFGAGARFFDNRLTLTPWLKVLKIPPHEVRIECMYISPVLGRSPFAWETSGGTLMQFRYRVGF